MIVINWKRLPVSPIVSLPWVSIPRTRYAVTHGRLKTYYQLITELPMYQHRITCCVLFDHTSETQVYSTERRKICRSIGCIEKRSSTGKETWSKRFHDHKARYTSSLWLCLRFVSSSIIVWYSISPFILDLRSSM